MLSFTNQYTTAVYVTFMWYTPGCNDDGDPLGDWSKAGWYFMDPGQHIDVFDADLDEINRSYCYYAEADDGAVWAGPYIHYAPNFAFDWCEWLTTNNGRDVGYKLLDVGDSDDVNVILTA